MQTFVPLATQDFSQIAQVLDNRRLNKQALEGWQIILNLLELDPQGNHRKSKGWSNHPAVRMWDGSELLLATYVVAMTKEWVNRGYKTTIGDKTMATIDTAYQQGIIGAEVFIPEWMSNQSKFEAIAKSHREALLVKDYGWYTQFGWAEDSGTAPTEYTYIWETKEKSNHA